MSYSDIVGSISGLLQFAVGCYALRVSRRCGVMRIGWSFFGAFTVMALVHVLLSVHPFRVNLELGVNVNFFYEIISILLLATIAQVETVLRKRPLAAKIELSAPPAPVAKAKEQPVVKEQPAAKEEPAPSSKVLDELKEAIAKLQAENTQQKQAFDETEKTYQERLAASRQSEEALKEIMARLESDIALQKKAHEEAEKVREESDNAREEAARVREESQKQSEQADQAQQAQLDQLARLLEEREESKATVAMLQAELAQQKSGEDLQKTFEDQLVSARQAEADLRKNVALLESEVASYKQKQDVVETSYRELMTLLRQGGMSEVVALSQSRVAHIARIVNQMRQAKDIAKFMTRNPKGKQLPQSLALLVEYLSDEQYLLLRKIESVKRKVEELKRDGNGTTTAVVANGDQPLAAESPADFRDHVIPSVTETGTEIVDPAAPATAAEPAEVAAAESPEVVTQA